MTERTRAPERRQMAKRKRTSAERSLAAGIRHQIQAERKAAGKRDRRAQSLRDEGRYSDAARTQANADTHRSREQLLQQVLTDSSSKVSTFFDEAEAREAIRGLAPKQTLHPDSQFVKGYNRALRDVHGALDKLTEGGETDD